MTIASSGSMVLPTALTAEMKTTGSLDLTGSLARWLTDKPSGSIIYPTNAYGKSAVKYVSAQAIGGAAGTMTFTAMDFGVAIANRTLIACVGLFAANNQILDQTSCTIGGSGTAGGDTGENTVSTGSAGVGLWENQVAGTSGNVVVTYGAGVATAGYCIILSTVNLVGVAGQGGTIPSGSGSASGASAVVTVLDGVLISAVARSNNTNAISQTNVTALNSATVGGVHAITVGFANRVNASAGYSVPWSSTGITASGQRLLSFS